MSDTQRAEVSSSARRIVHFTCRVLFVLLLGGTAASAQTTAPPADQDNYPSRTIRYVVPYPPGGFNDTLARIVSQKLSEAWGVPVVVENRPGGGTLIGSKSVAKAPPDGYTLLGVAFPFGANPSIYKNLPYDTLKDFTPLIFAGQTQNLLVIKPSMPINSVQGADRLRQEKSRQGQLRLHRHRLVQPSVDGIVQEHDRDRPRARAV